MSVLDERLIKAIQAADSQLSGKSQLFFRGAVALFACGGSGRATEKKLGWSRENVKRSLAALRDGIDCPEAADHRGKLPIEAKTPGLADDIRAVLTPRSQQGSKGRATWRFITLTAREARQLLVTERGWDEAKLPSVRTMGAVMHRLRFRRREKRRGNAQVPPGATVQVFLNVTPSLLAALQSPEDLERLQALSSRIAGLGVTPLLALPEPPEPVVAATRLDAADEPGTVREVSNWTLDPLEQQPPVVPVADRTGETAP